MAVTVTLNTLVVTIDTLNWSNPYSYSNRFNTTDTITTTNTDTSNYADCSDSSNTANTSATRHRTVTTVIYHAFFLASSFHSIANFLQNLFPLLGIN